ncbi:MAG: HD domain-containing protein [bacterium]
MKIKDIPIQISEQQLNFVRKYLNERKKHTQSTLDIIKKLLTCYQPLEEIKDELYLAVLFHDCARELSSARQQELAEKFRGSLDKIEKNVPSLWHGPAGAQLLVEELNFSPDDKIVQVVANHSTGVKNPGRVLKGLVVADFSEKLRDFSEAQKLRNKIGSWSFNRLTRAVFKNKIIFCLHKSSKLHPNSIEAYNSLCD